MSTPAVTHDVLVVGSGASGAMAAQTLAESGLNVGVVDVGRRDERYRHRIPDTDFMTIRETSADQHEYFLGDDFEGLGWDDTRVGSQLTPPRTYLARDVDRLLPLVSDAFQPLESLAYGGLGGGWGIGCNVYAPSELARMSLPTLAMEEAYRVVAERIGISGEPMDDAAPYCLGWLDAVQRPPYLEPAMARLLAAYERGGRRLRRRGIVMGRSALALLTEPTDGREATADDDMGFWSDAGRSAYRSWITMDELRRTEAVAYYGGQLVTRFAEVAGLVRLTSVDPDSGDETIYVTRRLVLAAGVLGTARVVLRSQAPRGHALPVLCNPYTYVPCLQPTMFGAAVPRRKTSFSPLVVHDDPSGTFDDARVASLFTYRSLLLFKLIKEAPLNFADGRRVMRYLQSSLVIAGIHHPDAGRPERRLWLAAHDGPTGDALHVDWTLDEDERQANRAHERRIGLALASLGCVPMRVLRTPAGASIHYGGTLPTEETGAPFTIGRAGRLAGTQSVFVADGSGFRYLPARGPTFTIMANAHRVAKAVAQDLGA